MSYDAATQSGPTPLHTATLSMFVVEDSAVIRENLIATLEELAPVRVVGCAEEEQSAVVWLEAHRLDCDVVIVDVFLKSGSGLGVLRGCADATDGPSYVVLTNYATAEMRAKCLALGARRVFDKSSDIEALVRYCEDLARLGRGH
jgi:DNA-binding NarL/FixJ family response regulator